LQRDYEELDRLGVSVKGAIVIARYGNSWRGIKPKIAAEHGAIGCIIYSDPRDDGYFQDDVFPDGPMRNENGVQRGSVMDMPIYPGDPTTPGVGSKGDVKRLALKDIPTLTKIPTLPISYGDAKPLLVALKGPVAPESFRGALPLTYHVGPGPAKVHLKVAFNWDIKPVYDVVFKIPGSESPDQWIVRGNHHDGWVNGAEDPISGQSALLEEARALGELLKQGWKPRRTIIYAAWDGEEPGLLGSTEWVEAHLDELRAHGAVYINTDGNDRGYLSMSGSHTLEKFINDVARDVQDPETGLSVWKRDQLRQIRTGTAEERKEARDRSSLRIDALGSGSDFTPFLQHAGIATLDLEFSGEGDGGIYHSIYDDFYWYTHFSDTSFVYGRALAQVVGTAVLRLADAELLPYDFSGLAETVTRYSTELQKLLKDQQDTLEERSKQLDEGVFAATTDPWEPEQAPAREGAPPFLNFAPLQNATDSLARAAARYERAVTRIREGGEAVFAKLPLDKINASLAGAEQRLLDPKGLPGRPWFQHLLYAPGFYTGYDVKTVPAVREALEQKQWQAVEPEIARVSQVLLAEASLVSELAAQLGGGN
jgi:N-acetylated-alpha-linked acidic dipeptidase